MAYWDYCIKADGDAPSISARAAELGWDGICILSDGKVREGGTTSLVRGLLIEASSPEGLKRAVRSRRKEFGIIAVLGKDEEMNRAATETAEADILIPAAGTKVDVIMARLARENGVRIAFDFSQLLHSTLEERGRLFSQMAVNAMCVRKARAPFILTSGALSEFGLRAPSELSAFGRLLGFQDAGCMSCIDDRLVRENMKRLSGRWVMPGVEVEA